MKLSELYQLFGLGMAATGAASQEDISVANFSIDTRTLKSGDVFVAIRGDNYDGHDFIADAEKKGAIACIHSRAIPDELIKNKSWFIRVDDTKDALAKCAAFYRKHTDVKVIGITGSCGKTTTKELLAAILSQVAPTLFAESSFNNDIGVPLTLLRLRPEHRYAVIEMGANHAGEIEGLTQLARPDVAIVTNIAPVHIEGFGSLDVIARTKADIYHGLLETGTAIWCADDAYAPLFKEDCAGRNCLTFGVESSTGDVTADDIQFDARGRVNFELHTPGNTACCIQLNLLGKHNVLNALAAASAAQAPQIPLDVIQRGLATAGPAKHRLTVCEAVNGATLIDDCYNASPIATRAALEILAGYKHTRIWIFADMKELGDISDEAHRDVGYYAKKLGINYLFALGTATRQAVVAFGSGGTHYASQAELIQAVLPLLNAETTVLVKGSRSNYLEHVVSALIPARATN